MTAPPRENGGNQDIKNFTAGTRVFYPVFVDGANLSFGDLHFSKWAYIIEPTDDGCIVTETWDEGRPESIIEALSAAGFRDARRDLYYGVLSEYRGVK